MIKDIKANPDMRDSFYRYCLGDKDMNYIKAEMMEQKRKEREERKRDREETTPINDRMAPYHGILTTNY